MLFFQSGGIRFALKAPKLGVLGLKRKAPWTWGRRFKLEPPRMLVIILSWMSLYWRSQVLGKVSRTWGCGYERKFRILEVSDLSARLMSWKSRVYAHGSQIGFLGLSAGYLECMDVTGLNLLNKASELKLMGLTARLLNWMSLAWSQAPELEIVNISSRLLSKGSRLAGLGC